MKYTIVGATGFIGSHMLSFMKSMNVEIFCPEKNYDYNQNEDLGVVFYCAGYGDCKNDVNNVVDANVNKLKEILTAGNFSKLIYVSSTRVYINADTSSENSDLIISFNDERKLFNLSKLVAEELCRLSSKKVIIVRPSNVYGLAINSPLFLPQIIKNAITNHHVDMFINPDYEKDYVSVDDVVYIMYQLSLRNDICGEVFNIASGYNISAENIAEVLASTTGCNIKWHANNTKEIFPVTNMEKTNAIIPHNYKNMLDDLQDMIEEFKIYQGQQNGR
ncbi:NAD(P)-dependent oxidoreductase [Buttiauxella sp. A111]|uniref:NAD-dependent epimerase/dehydratase family protein n=1 Tax=Buttiauxella sp. A111 TaxID=2563088 RepID=UPI0010DE396B|nr:NAD-dependent epimerase/dehydratase family protein [Buttiauxella sp. A111]GDX04567.1 SDR family oxidoreductase [Buttiauxella sp. A111]